MSIKIIFMSRDSSQEATTLSYLLAQSFKKKIILRIVASVRHYLSVLDIENAEKGLISLLNLVGYISSDIIEVTISAIKLTY